MKLQLYCYFSQIKDSFINTSGHLTSITVIENNWYIRILLGWQVPVLDSSDTTYWELACGSVHPHYLPPAAHHLQLSSYILTHTTTINNLILSIHKIHFIHMRLHTHTHTHTHTHRKLINTLTTIPKYLLTTISLYWLCLKSCMNQFLKWRATYSRSHWMIVMKIDHQNIHIYIRYLCVEYQVHITKDCDV
jgi:hypothetical protein